MTDAAFPVPGIAPANTAAQWEDLFAAPLLLGGVVPGVGNSLAGSLDISGRHAVLGSGGAIMRGYYKPVTAPTNTPIPAASSQNRIDRLVLRLDRSQTDPDNWITPVIITGAPGATPAEPPIVRTTSGLWDLPICSWTSQHSGALAGLTDERYYCNQVLAGLSTARPTPAGTALMIEQDTGNLMMYNAGAWTAIAQSFDRTTHVITNFAVNHWNGTLAYAMVAPNLVAIAAEISLGSRADVSDGTVICNVSSAYAPKNYHHVPLRTDAIKVSPQGGSNSFETASLSFRADGGVAVYGVSIAASVLEGAGSYPLSF